MPTQVNWKIILLCLVLFSGLLSLLAFGQKKQTLRSQASGTVTLRLSPAEKHVSPGETFDISVLIDTREDVVSAVDLSIAYDLDKLQLIELHASDNFSVILQNSVMENGLYNGALGTSPSSPFRGTGIVATMSFQALNSGETSITLTDQSMVAAIGKNENVLSQTYPVRITIRSSVGPTETPIPTPTWSITPTPTLLPKPSPWVSPSPLPAPASLLTPEPTETFVSPTPTVMTQMDMVLPREFVPGKENSQPSLALPSPPTSPFPSWLDAIFQAIADIVCRVAPCTR